MPGKARPRKQAIAVCLIERNALAASYLRDILKRDPGVQILSEEFVPRSWATAQSLAPVFAIDAGTLPGSLVGYLTVLRSRVPEAKTLILAEELSSDDLRRLPFLGIQGFVAYHEVKAHLREALRAISGGETWFPPEVLNEFQRYSGALRVAGASATLEKDVFTPRERMIVGLVDRRLGNKEIAAALNISESTVKFHLSNVFRKLGVRDRHSAASLMTPPGSTPAPPPAVNLAVPSKVKG